jgi:hypothetical protein
MIYSYKGSKIVASSKKEAISKIIADKQMSDEEVKEYVSALLRIITNIDGVKSVKPSVHHSLGKLIVNLYNGYYFTLYVENDAHVVITFLKITQNGSNAEYRFVINGKDIDKREKTIVIDCIRDLIKASNYYRQYQEILNKWDNR